MLDVALFPARVATGALGVLGVMGAILSITGIFGMAAYSVSKRLKELGIRMALGARRREVLGAALGRAVKLLAHLGRQPDCFLGCWQAGCWLPSFTRPRRAIRWCWAGVVLAMSLLGLLATWIPAQRALSVNPLVLLRED